jgi:hypoxanthine-DNA glycosylase
MYSVRSRVLADMEEKIIYCGFPPLCGENPRILILGTFPSPLSREKGEYYGNPRNQFWKIIYKIFDTPYSNIEYEQKKALLFANGVAVWDVIAECEAEGALDSTISNPVYNMGLPEFIAARDIKRVFFNGNNAYTFYKRGIGSIEKNVLPSTSPANAGMRFEDKVELWREICNI